MEVNGIVLWNLATPCLTQEGVVKQRSASYCITAWKYKYGSPVLPGKKVKGSQENIYIYI